MSCYPLRICIFKLIKKRCDIAHSINRQSINFDVSKLYLQLLPNGRANNPNGLSIGTVFRVSQCEIMNAIPKVLNDLDYILNELVFARKHKNDFIRSLVLKFDF